jgi:hypothetical protein
VSWAGKVAVRTGASQLPRKTAPRVPSARVADVTELLGETINQVRGGRIDPRSANTLGYLAAAMLKALQQGDIEARLRAIEAVLTSTPPKH